MTGTKETKELLLAVARLIKDVDAARDDGNGISIMETVGIVTSNVPSIVTAVRGAGLIPGEARDFTTEELEDLYFSFLTEMGWDPTDDNRDLARAYFILIRDTYTNVLLILNTKRPPKAIPV